MPAETRQVVFVCSERFNYLPIPECDPASLIAAEAGGPACISAVGPLPGSFANDPSLRETMNTGFGNDVQRGYKQLAFFGSVDFDLIEKVLEVRFVEECGARPDAAVVRAGPAVAQVV